jgi:hypothetical protein
MDVDEDDEEEEVSSEDDDVEGTGEDVRELKVRLYLFLTLIERKLMGSLKLLLIGATEVPPKPPAVLETWRRCTSATF